MKERILIGLFVVLMVFGMVNLTGAELLVSDAGVEYESDVLEVLNITKWASVTIKIQLKDEIKREEIISKLTKNEFELNQKFVSKDGFNGNITQEGFNRLVNNEDIRSIFLSRVGHVIGNGTLFNGEEILEDILSVKFKEGLSDKEKEEIINSYNATIIKISINDRYRIKIPDDKTIIEMIELFKLDPNIESVNPIAQTQGTSPDEGEDINGEEETTDKEKINIKLISVFLAIIIIIAIVVIFLIKKRNHNLT